MKYYIHVLIIAFVVTCVGKTLSLPAMAPVCVEKQKHNQQASVPKTTDSIGMSTESVTKEKVIQEKLPTPIDYKLLYAVIQDRLNDITATLKNGADVNACDSQSYSTALHWAALFNNVAATKILLANHANINAQNKKGNTPLHLAVLWGHLAIITVLLLNNADITITNNEGKIARDLI